MCSLCRLPVAENHNFWQIWTFWGSYTGPLLPMRVTFGVLKQTKRQISSECVHSVGFRWPKTTIFGQFWLLGASRSVYSIALWRRKKQFLPFFWTSAFSDVDSWRKSEKVEHGCTTTNLPLSNGIKIISVLQRLHGEIGQTNSDVSVTDKKASRTDKKLNVLSPTRRRVKSEPHQTWYGGRGPQARSCIFKTFGGLTHSFAARALKIWEWPDPIKLKPP